MSTPLVTKTPSHLPGRLALCLLIGLLLAVQIYLRNKNFLNVNFDGWSYWEGASAFSAGKGYVDLLGRPIVAFPPLFSLYLSFFARHGELTLGSIKSSFVVLAFLVGSVWSWLALQVFVDARPGSRWLAITLPLLLFPLYFDMLLSEPFWLLLVGLLLIVLTLNSRSMSRYLFVGGLLSLCLLTRNVSVALLPSIPLLVLPMHGIADARKVFLAALSGTIAWLSLRSLTGSSGSHRYGVDLLALLSDFADSLIAMGRDFTYSRLVIGPILSAILILACLLFIVRRLQRRPDVLAGKTMGWLSFSIALFVFTVLASHLTMVGAAQSRFYLVAFAAGLYGVLLCSSLLPSSASKGLLALVLVLYVSASVYRNGFFLMTKLALPPADDSFYLSRPWLDRIHNRVEIAMGRGQTMEEALAPYPISVLRYKHWMGIPYPLQSH